MYAPATFYLLFIGVQLPLSSLTYGYFALNSNSDIASNKVHVNRYKQSLATYFLFIVLIFIMLQAYKMCLLGIGLKCNNNFANNSN